MSGDLSVVLPELIVSIGACLLLLVDLMLPHPSRAWLAYLGLLIVGAAGAATIMLGAGRIEAFGGLFILDPFSSYFKLLLYLATALTILLSIRYLEIERIHLGEYYAFLLLATCGLMVMVSSGDLLPIFLGLELAAVSLYSLAGLNRHDARPIEASAKYFVLGSLSAAIFLFGMSLLFGATGTTQLEKAATALAHGHGGPMVWLGMIFLLAGFGFKAAVVPFHMWTPDVYEGAPTSVTAYMSVAMKTATFAVFMRVFLEVFGPIKPQWTAWLIGLSLATMVVGNLAAIVQQNIKRMLAYSSIAHAGYAMIGLIVGGELGMMSLMLYMAIYTVMNLGAFGVVILMRRAGVQGEQIGDLAGLAKEQPAAALAMLIFMFSLAGLPPTAGFVAKFYLFMAAVDAGLAWLAVASVLLSAVSAYYYLRVVMVMYMKEPSGPIELAWSPSAVTALVVILAVTLLIGLYPSPLVSYTQDAVLRLSAHP
ncbi:MAG TPA: NADH-quinone oxidoreductase subunit N [Nitrospiria bacterium]|nr:NADH-quinone oxidoreductase subunit N [Nitrospiria bacterium]